MTREHVRASFVRLSEALISAMLTPRAQCWGVALYGIKSQCFVVSARLRSAIPSYYGPRAGDAEVVMAAQAWSGSLASSGHCLRHNVDPIRHASPCVDVVVAPSPHADAPQVLHGLPHAPVRVHMPHARATR